MQAVQDIKPINSDIKPQLPTPDASPTSTKTASPRPTRVFLPPPRSFTSFPPTSVLASSQIQEHIAFALACGRAAQLAGLKRTMVNSALEARSQREREVLRLVETSAASKTINKDVEENDSEGDVKMEDMPERSNDSARSSTSARMAVAPSTNHSGGLVHKRRTFTLLLTEHTSRRPAPYAIPAPRSMISKPESLPVAHALATSRTSSTRQQQPSPSPRRRLSLPTCLLSLSARSKLPPKPSLQISKSRPSIINTTWTHSLNEQRRAAFTLSAMAMGRLGAIKEESWESGETRLMCDESSRLCGRRGKAVRPLRLL